jgi:hypothetical protein
MPTPEEAKEQSFNMLAGVLGLDEFQRIAARTLLDDIGDLDFPNVTPEQEKKLMDLGSIVSEKYLP